MHKYERCACHSKVLYHKCCQPFHQGTLPHNALQLMRSRYAAYAIGLPDYIIATTHPENPSYGKDHKSWKKGLIGFRATTRFDSLKILEFIDGESEAYVKFEAGLRQNDQDASFTERSKFLKIGGKWLYHSGEIN